MLSFMQVRNSPLYHLIKARALKKLGKHEECLKTLKAAMSLPALKQSGSSGSFDSVVLPDFQQFLSHKSY